VRGCGYGSTQEISLSTAGLVVSLSDFSHLSFLVFLCYAAGGSSMGRGGMGVEEGRGRRRGGGFCFLKKVFEHGIV